METSGAKKSLYVFLSSLLGILLFVTIQRALSLIGLLLLNVDYATYSLGTTPLQVHAWNITTLILAIFFGGWYGIWLGLYWYKIVYEHGSGGIFHGLAGNFFHDKEQPVEKRTIHHPKQEPEKVFKSQTHHSRSLDAIEENSSHNRWEFDELLNKKRNSSKLTKSAPTPRVATRESIAELSLPTIQKRVRTAKKSPSVTKPRQRSLKTKVAAS
jgi:signal transduction histidine kinase